MLTQLKHAAAARSLPSCVLTFDPHPKVYFANLLGRPELAPAQITSLDDKLDQLAGCGIDQVAVLTFDAQVAAIAPEDFINRIILQGLHARYLLVGDDFRFGARREGDFALLEAAAAMHGMTLDTMHSYLWRGIRVSSTEVRKAITSGDVMYAAGLLGQRFYGTHTPCRAR
jgi:riboflavin kinase/FMN adenylyltransferase